MTSHDQSSQDPRPEASGPNRAAGSAVRVVGPGQNAEFVTDRVVVRVETAAPGRSPLLQRMLVSLLITSLILNAFFLLQAGTGTSDVVYPEHHVSGERGARNRIAIINFEGTISPPFTERWIRQIRQAAADDSIRGVLLAVDSPGGLVADSHQIYRELQKLREKKPIFAAMKRLAASGGYYISMGVGPEGKIYAEPTTWTGSIGVIVPRYNATELAANIGVKVESLKTGPLKDTLSPFRDMTAPEHAVWDAILKDAFDRFVTVIADNRGELDDTAVRELATGQIYTASQALEHHLVDQIGYVEDAVQALADQLQLSSHEAVEYRSAPGLLEAILGAEQPSPATLTEQIMDAAVPRAMYYASWNPWVPIR